MKEQEQLTDDGAKRMAILVWAIRHYGIEKRVLIKEILNSITDFTSPEFDEGALLAKIRVAIDSEQKRK